jgi:hypothetical protein
MYKCLYHFKLYQFTILAESPVVQEGPDLLRQNSLMDLVSGNLQENPLTD